MATNSDFAQKLLHDLRLRKEQMAANQGSSNSNSMVRGSYGNPGQAYKGFQLIKALESVGSRSGNSFGKTRNGTRSYIIEDSSNQIVPYGRETSPGQMGDLSAALAFGFGNGGKLGKMDASGNIQMLNFLQHIGRRSLDKGTMEIRSNFGKSSTNTHFPTFSHIHIHEVSKGVQKLNQILRACSNGLNFDRYSIEVGRELLKGAMHLEESLRMLVNLREASDYMISTQRKNKIRLLEDDEEDESETAKLTGLKQLDHPRFSFDKPSRNSHCTKETAKNGIKQQLMALTYPEETTRLQEKQSQSTSNFITHTTSASYLPNYGNLSTYLEPKTQSISSHSKPEKGRISNVIAKLMGLEELPAKGDIKTKQKELSSQRKELMASKKHGISADSNPQQTENRLPFNSHKKAVSSQITPSRDTRFEEIAEKIQAIPNGSSKVVISEENANQQDSKIAGILDATSVSKIATVIMDKQQRRDNQPGEVGGYRKILHEQRKGENNNKEKENSIINKGESKDLFMNNELHPKAAERRRVSEDDTSENTEIKKNAVQTGKKNAGSTLISKQQKHQYEHELPQPQVPKKFDHLQEKRKQQLPIQKLQAREPKGNQEETMVESKSKNSMKDLPRKQSYANLATASKKKPMKHIDVKPSKGLSNSRDIAPAIRETSMHVPQPQEHANNMKINANQTNQRILAVANRRNGTLNHSAGPLNPQSPVWQETEQQNDEKVSNNRVKQESEPHSKEAEAGITEFSETELSSQPADGAEQLHNVAEDITLDHSDANERQSLEVSKSLTSSDNPSNVAKEKHEVPHDHQHDEQPSVPTDGLQFHCIKALLTPDKGDHEGREEIFEHIQDGHKKIPSSGPADLLTEAEKQLKEILIKGQLFLNTAEALFKLNIPVSILHGSDHNGQDPDTKLTLDCAHELLKKKGRRQELAIYPYKEKSIDYVKIKSFNDLIKQLSKDFDMLKFSGGKGGEECDAADYLHKMLEKDIQNRKPDVNSMWDFSWNKKTFAFLEKDDIVIDVERRMLNGLLDEITSDLLYIAVSA